MVIEELGDLRRKIDAIDDEIIDLLVKRTGLVKQVGERKARASKTPSFIRPGREATMVRRLAEKINGHMPQAAIIAIWRQIISASLSIEQAMPLAAYASRENKDCYWLAREYFGTFLPLSTCEDITQVIRQVVVGDAVVGIIPYNETLFTSSHWWKDHEGRQSSAPQPTIFACIPFSQQGDNLPPALAIAKVNPEPTGDDTTVATISLDATVSVEGLLVMMRAAGLPGKSLWREVSGNTLNVLVEIEGFVTRESREIAHVAQQLADKNIKISFLGAYANPVELVAGC